MAKSWGIEALGLEDSVKVFKGIEEAFGAPPLKECLMPIAMRIRDYAKGRVKTGPGSSKRGGARKHLRDLIFASSGKSDLPSVIVGVDRKKAPHAHLVEFGHGGKHPAPPHPFLRPAFDAFRKAAVDMAGKEISERIIKKIVRESKRDLEALARAARREFSTKL